ncbi:MAG: FAD:protein FMN transferase [Candidatus Moraniibacteriota bacterium]
MKKTELEFRALGTDIHLQVICDDWQKNVAENNLRAVKDFYISVEKIFSRFDENSELSYFNQNLGKFLKASPHFMVLAKKNLEYYTLSEEIFDPRIIEILEWIGYEKDFRKSVPAVNVEKDFPKTIFPKLAQDLIIQNEEVVFKKRMDFAGIAKGYVTDMAGEMLKKAGFQNFLIDSGGDMFVAGVDQKGESWKIDVAGIAENKILLILKNEAVATSGIGKRKWESGGKRFHHLVNPKELENFSFDLQSVTVVAPSVTEADFWAKVLFLKGKVEGKKFASEHKIKSIFLDYRGNAWISGEMKNNI